jgi:hypothetical protein
MSAMPWYEWRTVREAMTTFGRAIQGVSPYRVLIEPDKGKCPTGYCDFRRREIAVNPAYFALPAEDAYRAAQALLLHEAGHRRFTTPARMSSVVAFISNLLEDQRVESLMAEQFAGLRPLVTYLAELMVERVPEARPESESPGEVLSYLLAWRFAARLGKPGRGALSARNQLLWEQVRPIAEEAWVAKESSIVDQCAARIARLLGLREIPRYLREAQGAVGEIVGERNAEDIVERESPGKGKPASGKDEEISRDPGLPPLPDDHPAGKGRYAIDPAPYLELLQATEVLAQELIEELRVEEQPEVPVPQERGRRLSIRQLLRTPETPFLEREEERKELPSLSFRLLVDYSTSMNWSQRMRYAQQGAMVMHRVAVELGIDHQIAATPNNMLLADLQSGERGLALIAGLEGKTSWEDIGLAIQIHGQGLLPRAERIKLILCVHDGQPNDAELAREECRKLIDKSYKHRAKLVVAELIEK